MKFEIDYQDGEPAYVHTDNGFCVTGQPFDHAQHGWMLKQIHPNKLLVTRMFNETMDLVDRVNELERELHHTKQMLAIYQGGSK